MAWYYSSCPDHFIWARQIYAPGTKSELAIKRSAHKIMIDESFMAPDVMNESFGGERKWEYKRICLEKKQWHGYQGGGTPKAPGFNKLIIRIFHRHLRGRKSRSFCLSFLLFLICSTLQLYLFFKRAFSQKKTHIFYWTLKRNYLLLYSDFTLYFTRHRRTVQCTVKRLNYGAGWDLQRAKLWLWGPKST